MSETDNISVPPINLSELYVHIYNNIDTPYNIIEIHKELEFIIDKSKNAVEEFKNILLELTNLVIIITDNHLIGKYKANIYEHVAKNPKNIVDTFIVNAYMTDNGIYRKHIILGNDGFFTGKDFTPGDNSAIMFYISQFKTFWGKITENDKTLIKTFLLTLCFYSDKRFIYYYRYREMKRIHNEKFPDVFKHYDTLI